MLTGSPAPNPQPDALSQLYSYLPPQETPQNTAANNEAWRWESLENPDNPFEGTPFDVPWSTTGETLQRPETPAINPDQPYPNPQRALWPEGQNFFDPQTAPESNVPTIPESVPVAADDTTAQLPAAAENFRASADPSSLQERAMTFGVPKDPPRPREYKGHEVLGLAQEVSYTTGIQPAPSERNFSVHNRVLDKRVQPKVREGFTALQEIFGESFDVFSGYRTATANKNAKAAQRSQHLRGNAVDINVSGWPNEKRIKLIEEASKLGFTGIGVGKNTIHIDMRENRRSVWGYARPSGGGPVPSWAKAATDKHKADGFRNAIKAKQPENVAGQFAPVMSAYSPQKTYDPMEGGYASSRRGPDGKAVVRTLADVKAGRSDYITLAGDSSQYNREFVIPQITYLDAKGVKQTLTDVRAVVHDTGSAFRKKGDTRFDIPVDRDLPSRALNVQPFSMQPLTLIPIKKK